MGILQFIENKVCKQTAVYWGPPEDDGFGGDVFAVGIEIKCRWDDVSEMIMDKQGNQIVSNSKLLVVDELDENGFLFQGTLSELSTDQKSNPMEILKAYPIKKLMTSPLFGSSTEFVREVML